MAATTATFHELLSYLGDQHDAEVAELQARLESQDGRVKEQREDVRVDVCPERQVSAFEEDVTTFEAAARESEVLGSALTIKRESVTSRDMVESLQTERVEVSSEIFSLRQEWVDHESAILSISLLEQKRLLKKDTLQKTGRGTIRFHKKMAENVDKYFPLHPRSTFHSSWEIASVLLLSLDLIWLPLQAFNMPPNTFFSTVPLIFWTMDIFISFATGFYDKEGNLERGIRCIGKRYVRTWFLPDLFLVCNDWLVNIIEWVSMDLDEYGDFAKFTNTARLGRNLRCLRLLRIAKMREILIECFRNICAESTALVLEMLLSAVSLIALNHCVACAWFLIGLSEQTSTWVWRYEIEDASVAEQYALSLHWALTQFTPASMEVFPQNVEERIFTVVVILFAMLTFSSFVSSITSGMTRLRMLKAEKAKQEYMLRSFLKEHRISKDLSMRISRHIAMTVEIRRKFVPMAQVELLNTLTIPLQVELQKEIFYPWLCVHPFFATYITMDSQAAGDLFSGITNQAFAKGDNLFTGGNVASHMYFVIRGCLKYILPHVPGWGCRRDLSVSLKRGAWLAEAALWFPWVHRGTATMSIDSEIAVLDIRNFCTVTVKFPDTHQLAIRRAHEFLKEIQEQERHQIHDALGIEMFAGVSEFCDNGEETILETMARESRNSVTSADLCVAEASEALSQRT